MRAAAHDRQVGQTLEVISERKEGQDGDYEGVADNYVRVKLPGWLDGGQEIVRVKIERSQGEFVEGEVLWRARAS
jgi:tRNA A37 methylthiotransferase MiaB